MPLGYKYAERDASNQTDWYAVGKSVSGMLLETNRLREEKKDAYDQATRKSINDASIAPQGENESANTFINNYSHDVIEQIRIDDNLFKRGQMSERDKTLRMQNQMDGTKALFDLSKAYQEKFKDKMDGVTSGVLQSMNIFNMSMVEGYANFNNSKAIINPFDGTVGIGLMEDKVIDGKTVRVLSKDIAPVGVIAGKIAHDIPTFDVEKATNDSVKAFGDRKDVLYRAANTARAGSITEFLGIGAMKNHPEFARTVKSMNDAIDQQIGSYFSNEYNLSSVLTENLGKYNDKSFTFSKSEAATDKNKILVKVDPTTSMTALDASGPNYQAQKKEASDWVRTNILSKMDSEVKMSMTSQSQLQESARTRAAAEAEFRAPTAASKAVEPIVVGEILRTKGVSPQGKPIDGVSQRIEHLVSNEGKGIQNVITNIGYNNSNGALELKGYQILGRESSGNKTEAEGTTGTESSTIIKKNKFLKNDIDSAPLLSTMVRKIPNPENPGYNFYDIKEAKDYYKRQYQATLGTPTPPVTPATNNTNSNNDPLGLGL